MKYWTSVDGTGGFSAPPLLNLPSSSVLKPRDVFCYDQDGNLYILYYDGQYKVKRFPLKADGTYDTSLAEELELSGLTTTETLKAIAVDISDGQYSVYCAASNTIEKFSSHNSFNHVMKDSSYTINVSLPLTITALAANKDGVFVGVCPERSATDYTLQVWKYHKQDGTYLGQVLVGTVQPPIQDTPPSTQDYYKRVVSTINDLQVVNGVLYAITSNKEEGMEHTTAYITDSFKMSSALYKVGNTARTFSGSAELLCNRPAVEPEGLAATGTGYNFYRFNAVKPQKLVIASDGAWGKDGSSVGTPGLYMNYNKVFEYDLARQDVSERNAGGTFSKELEFGTGFDWQ